MRQVDLDLELEHNPSSSVGLNTLAGQGLAGGGAAQLLQRQPLTQFCPAGRLCLGYEGRGVLLHQAIQHDLLRAVTLAVDRSNIWRLLRLPADGFYVGLPMG